MGNYTLDQAQKDIAALRGQLAHLKAGSNAFTTGQFDGTSTAPSSVAGSAMAYADINGALDVVDGLDGNTYSTERLPTVSAETSGTTAVTVFSAAVGIRTYRIRGVVFFNSSSTGMLTVETVVPA